MKMSYAWSMPDKQTFRMKPIKIFIQKEMLNHLHENILVPFAGWFRFNGKGITYIDILKDLPKPYILGDCMDIMWNFIKKGRKFSLIISDPPYSMYQAVRTYGNLRMQDITRVRNLYSQLLSDNGVVISCGYNSTGMSKKRGFKKTKLLVVNCGGSHNDFLILKEKKIQTTLM